MKLATKLVALLLAGTLLAPASISGLWASPTPMGMHCSGCGPALAPPTAPVVPQAGAGPGRCCEVSSGKPAPTPASIAPQGSPTQMSPPAAVEAPSAPPAQEPARDPAPSPTSSACPQALHCSFLI